MYPFPTRLALLISERTLPVSCIWACPLFQKGYQSKIKDRMAKRVDLDEMAHYKPSHLDVHCFQSYLFWLAGLAC